MKYDIKRKQVYKTKSGDLDQQQEGAAERIKEEDNGWEWYDTVDKGDYVEYRYRRPADYEEEPEEEEEEE